MSAKKSTKPQHFVWNFFNKVEIGKTLKGKCKFILFFLFVLSTTGIFLTRNLSLLCCRVCYACRPTS